MKGIFPRARAWPVIGGYTLVELLVVLSLLALFMRIAYPSFHRQMAERDFSYSHQLLVTELQEIRDQNMRATEIIEEDIVYEREYGIQFSKQDTYRKYVDLVPHNKEENGEIERRFLDVPINIGGGALIYDQESNDSFEIVFTKGGELKRRPPQEDEEGNDTSNRLMLYSPYLGATAEIIFNPVTRAVESRWLR